MVTNTSRYRIKEALYESAQHLEALQRERELLLIKADGFDALSGLIHLLRPRNGGWASGIDPARNLRALHEALEDEDAREKEDQRQARTKPLAASQDEAVSGQ